MPSSSATTIDAWPCAAAGSTKPAPEVCTVSTDDTMVSALTAMRFAIHGQEVAVPLLVGLAPAEAERKVAALGLQISIERQYYSPQIAEGKIMSQLPLPGTKVRRGWQVRVAQSLGPTRVTIPNVTGESEHAAELNIRRRGLDVAAMAAVQTAGTPADQVLAQSPMANATQVVTPKISLLVTEAAEPQAFVMPSFAGQALGSASRSLQDAGFRLGNVMTGACDADAPGCACGAAVAADTGASSGAGFAREHHCVASAGSGAEGDCGGGR